LALRLNIFEHLQNFKEFYKNLALDFMFFYFYFGFMFQMDISDLSMMIKLYKFMDLD